MATNTFSTLKPHFFKTRPKTSYTFTRVMLPRMDRQSVYTHGTKAMTGWIRDSGGTPQSRVVELSVRAGGFSEVIARTVSDASNMGNNYFFNGLALTENGMRYELTVHHPDGTTAARIKDNRTPV